MIGKIIKVKDFESKWRILDKITIDGDTEYLVIEITDKDEFPLLDGYIGTISPKVITKIFGQI